MDYNFVRVAAIVPETKVADCEYNATQIITDVTMAANRGAKIIVLPELCITGYTCGDLFLQSRLLTSAHDALVRVCDATRKLNALIIVGAPLVCGDSVYNCAVVMSKGEIYGIVPKVYLPNYKEFYEKRWFASGDKEELTTLIDFREYTVTTKRVFSFDENVTVGVEICEDLWTTIPQSSIAALNGATVIVNLSASNELIGKHSYLVDLIRNQSARCHAVYVYASAGFGESTTDLVFAGNAIVAENGKILAEGERFNVEGTSVICDVDMELIANERRATTSFADCKQLYCDKNFYRIQADVYCEEEIDEPTLPTQVLRTVKRHPFVPSDDKILNNRCEEIISIQVEGLMRRLAAIHCKTLVVGVSGGLDSTLALLVAVKAFDRLKLDRKGIYGITMPGFGTTDRTYNNAIELMRALQVSVKEIPIRDAVIQHFKDIEQDIDKHDITYENSQARERTQILMDYANKCNGIVLGTGDLSELALGWATYNGDHMSMYGVNVSIPKTLVKYLVRWFAVSGFKDDEKARRTLLDIVDTPISPELIPADENGNIKQKTEDLVGPYELHDFFLFYVLRHGFSPRKIYLLAQMAFAGEYDDATIKKWLREFFRRFFQQQFKRSCLPDGPKVGSVSLSPRGDWRMPSDASAASWLAECDEL